MHGVSTALFAQDFELDFLAIWASHSVCQLSSQSYLGVLLLWQLAGLGWLGYVDIVAVVVYHYVLSYWLATCWRLGHAWVELLGLLDNMLLGL